jgi:hypothetical protein
MESLESLHRSGRLENVKVQLKNTSKYLTKLATLNDQQLQEDIKI